MISKLRAPLIDVIGRSRAAWAGPFGSLAWLELLGISSQTTAQTDLTAPCSSGRSICTSNGSWAPRGFQSVVRKPSHKPHSLTKTTLKAWRTSGFDLAVAESILERSEEQRWRKLQQAEEDHAQFELFRIMMRCSSLVELKAVVQQLAPHMGPDALVACVSRLPKLPLAHTPQGALDLGPCPADHLLDRLLPRLLPHTAALSTTQLAMVLSSVARLSYTMPARVAAAFRALLQGESATRHVSAAGSRELPALMMACARLGWGDASLWESFLRAAAGQLGSMSPEGVAQALSAACSPVCMSHTSTGAAATELWSTAQDLVLRQMNTYEPETLAQVLLSFARSGTSKGKDMRTQVLASLAPRLRGLPPQALVDLARGHTLVAARRGVQRVSQAMGQVCDAACYQITHFSMQQLHQLLSAVWTSGAGPSAEAGMLVKLAADVVGLRGFQQQQQGAAPAPLQAQLPAAAAHYSSGSSTCHVLLMLAELGHADGALYARTCSSAVRQVAGTCCGGAATGICQGWGGGP